MKFSIVTPSYNQGSYIQDCLNSVFSQLVSFERGENSFEVEHIVVDGLSTDETLEELRSWDDKVRDLNVKGYTFSYLSEKDHGMSDAINKGVLRASGNWWMWLNSDDYLLEGTLSKLTAFLHSNPIADVVYGDWIFVDGNKKFVKKMQVFPFDLRMLIHYGCYIGSTSCFFRSTSTVGRNELLNVQFRQVMDQEYYARLGKMGLNFFHLSSCLAAFRIHGSNTSLRHANAVDIKSIFLREQQLAESRTVSRFYGFNPIQHPIYRAVVEAILWTFYRLKKPLRRRLYQIFGR